MTSSQHICCDVDGTRLKSTKPKSASEIIFGWDRFNTISLAIIIVLFAIWCGVYFNVYQPGPKGGMGGHHGPPSGEHSPTEEPPLSGEHPPAGEHQAGGEHSPGSRLFTSIRDDPSAKKASFMKQLF